ncbi:MAG: rod shape-determining protein MreD [Chloroflexota bacterium]|nr:rod shape-determining protein MreD [Chloroflexota bacterium]
MPRVIFALILGAAALTQATLLPMVRVLGIKPHLVLVLLLLWGATREPREGLAWAFGAGVFLDLLTLSPLGLNALGLLPAVLIGWLSRNRFFQSGLLFPLVMALAATAAHDLALLLAAPFTGGYSSPLGALRLGTLAALLNTLVVPPLYLVVHLLSSWIGRNEAHVRA